MNAKKYSNFYTDIKRRYIKHKLMIIKDENNYLFAKGKYKTKILEEDLPDYFTKLYYDGKDVYVSTQNIKDMLYKPNYFITELYKDDFLYVSYDKPITRNETDEFYTNYEILIYGYAIVRFIKAVKENNTYDVRKIEKELEKKRKWYDSVK